MNFRKKLPVFLSRINPFYGRLTYIMNLNLRLRKDVKSLKEEVDGLKNSINDQNEAIHQLHEVLTGVNDSVDSTKQLLMRSVDITNIPRSTGVLRSIQEISYEMLSEIDRICKKHNLEYWLDFGTLLGAMRHKGFIPWDDDMDISMMNTDYEKFLDIVDDELSDTDYRFIRVPSQIGKVVHKDFMPYGEQEVIDFINWDMKGKLAFALDIFPYYFAKDKLKDQELKDKLLFACTDSGAIFDSGFSHAAFKKADKLIRRHLRAMKSDIATDRIFLGPETRLYQPRTARYDDVFPLENIEFEGGRFPAPRQRELYLINYYGDYMQFPSEMRPHLHLDTIPKDELGLLTRKQYKGK